MKPLIVVWIDGMISVKSEEMDYSLIPNMYEGRKAGEGIQVNPGVDAGRACAMCRKIADAISDYMEAGKTASTADISIVQCCFGTRAHNAIASNGCHTLGDIAKLTRDQVLEWRNVGEWTVNEIAHVLATFGLKLKGEA